MRGNSWPGGTKKAISQDEHESWNAHNYPGTRQLCGKCDGATGRCEEDSLFSQDGTVVCEECYENNLYQPHR